MITFDLEKCDRCGLCALACPNYLIEDGPSLVTGAEQMCISCGQCFAVCPKGALFVQALADAAFIPLPKQKPVKPEAMRTLLLGRRSLRRYKDVPVSREDLERILEAASSYPSASNFRPVRAYVYTDAKVIDAIRRATVEYYRRTLKQLSLPGMKWLTETFHIVPKGRFDYYRRAFMRLTAPGERDALFRNARTLLAFTVPPKDENAYADACLACHNAVLFAETIPVGSCLNGFLANACAKDPTVRSALGIPAGERLAQAVTMGYPKLKYAFSAPRKPMETVWK